MSKRLKSIPKFALSASSAAILHLLYLRELPS
jgi:hypothetical protein